MRVLCLSAALLLLLSCSASAASASERAAETTSYSILDYSREDLLSDERLGALFDAWAARHARSYGAEERARRLSVFRDNLAYIEEHNSRVPAPEFSLGLNRFADLTNEEYRARYVGSRLDREARMQRRLEKPTEFRYKDVQAPDSIDWREKGAVTAVKDQGSCGGFLTSFSLLSSSSSCACVPESAVSVELCWSCTCCLVWKN